MDTLEKGYRDIINEFFPETAHRIPIYKALKFEQNQKSSDALFEDFITTNKSFIVNFIKSQDIAPELYEKTLQIALIRIAKNIEKYDSNLTKSVDWLEDLFSDLTEIPKELKVIEEKSIDIRKEVAQNTVQILKAFGNNTNAKNKLTEVKSTLTSIIKTLNQREISTTKNDPLQQIRIRQRDPKIFNRKSMRTITLSKSLGIDAVIGELPKDDKTRVQTLIFNKDNPDSRVWTLKEAKSWVKSHKDRIKVSLNLKELLNKAKKIVGEEKINV